MCTQTNPYSGRGQVKEEQTALERQVPVIRNERQRGKEEE